MKFKRKCLPDIIQFRRPEDQQTYLGPKSVARQKQSQVCMRRREEKENLIGIFERMHQFYEVSKDIQGVEVTLKLLLEAGLLEFEETNQVVDSAEALFQFFTKIKYLNLEYKELEVYVTLLTQKLEQKAKDHTKLQINGEAFRTAFAKHIALLEDTHRALHVYNQSASNNNLYLRAQQGCRVIELLSQARLYYEIKKFSQRHYSPLLERDFEWMTESAYLDMHCFEILQALVNEGTLFLGTGTIKEALMSERIEYIVNKLVQTRNYAMALDLNERAKTLLKLNYDLELIQKPLKMETKIYERMHKDNRENYASYFKVMFVGAAHLPEFRDKTFILRAIQNESSSAIIE